MKDEKNHYEIFKKFELIEYKIYKEILKKIAKICAINLRRRNNGWSSSHVASNFQLMEKKDKGRVALINGDRLIRGWFDSWIFTGIDGFAG